MSIKNNNNGLVRCNNCMNVFDEDITECPICKSEEYLMDNFEEIKEIKNGKKDYLGKILHIGDDVCFMQIGYRGLMKGKIIHMSDKKAKISHDKTNTAQIETIQFYSQIIKI